jgi:hypothetical protein
MNTALSPFASLLLSCLFTCGFLAIPAQVVHAQNDTNGDTTVQDQSDETGDTFGAALSGNQEVPPRETPAIGATILRQGEDDSVLEYKIAVADITNVVAAHLHLGPFGENGPIVVPLFGPADPAGGTVNGTLVEGQITADDLTGPLAGASLDTLEDLIEAGNIYVNVHTDDGVEPPDSGPGDFPNGEIRSQVSLVGPAGEVYQAYEDTVSDQSVQQYTSQN